MANQKCLRIIVELTHFHCEQNMHEAKKNIIRKNPAKSIKNETPLTLLSLIEKKKRGKELSAEEISFFIDSVTEGSAPDYQIAALLMAIFLKNINKKETYLLTKAMLESGHVFDVFNQHTIDKHSTGGIGDKSSLVLAPLAAACGVTVPMIAGRGLGHTGGTVDKLESIPGFNTALTIDQFSDQLKKFGLVLMGQTESIAPADRKLYALRDVTGTVDHIGLITASIMSKKLAEGAAGIVMDIKFGSAAFMPDKKSALKLAKSISAMGAAFGKKVTCFITDMNGPTGVAMGNASEVLESLQVLQGRGPADLRELCLELTAEMVFMGKLAKNKRDARFKVEAALASGLALKKFDEFIALQGGPNEFSQQAKNLLKIAPVKTLVVARKKGYVQWKDAYKLGEILTTLGGGRRKKTDLIDHAVGIQVNARIGDKVQVGDTLMIIEHHEHQKNLIENILKEIEKDIVVITPKKPTSSKLIWKII
ncbi:MAG: thymidine phosphorylase [Bacteriovoracaceae bacterium]|nr:thymidine phosphorylase [Bacteriovoracaceae bacterium]